MRRHHILVVEDAAVFREIASSFLERLARVSTADSGRAALEVARRDPPDLIVAALGLPDLAGDALCGAVRDDPGLRGVPLVLVTSGASADEHERAVRAGAADVLSKPLLRARLLDAAARQLRRDRRGQARAALVTEVELWADDERCTARSLNVSRGGLFVETDHSFEPDTELRVAFRAPGGRRPCQPTARVAWRRLGEDGGTVGLGLQFLRLERTAAQQLEDYVSGRTALP